MASLKKDMKDFYSSSNLYLEQLKKHHLSMYAKYIAKIFKYAKKGRILDIGCGTGQIANFLSEKGYQATGIDISPLFIKEAKKSNKSKFLVMDLEKLKFSDNSFDAIISSETLEHVLEPEAALKEAIRVLKHSGILILRFPNRQSKLINLMTLLTKKPRFEIVQPNLSKEVYGDDEDLCHNASTSDVLVFLKKNNFKILYSKPFFWPSALIVARKK